MNTKQIWVTGVMVAGCIGLAVPASATTIINGSFENASVNPGGSFVTLGAGSTAINGWTVGGGGIDYIGGYWNASDGSRSIDLSGNSDGGISQSLDTIIGQSYRVTFDLAGNPDGGTGLKVAVTSIGGFLPQTDTFTVGPSNTRGDMGWQTYTYTFKAFGANSLLTFASEQNPNSAYGPALDNVSIAAVPEPATWGLMFVGFGLIGASIRRRNMRTSVRFA